MKTINAIIVDEERLARVNLRRMLECFPEIAIVGEANSCEYALELINFYKPQLVFLDIELHGESGFDMLEYIDNSITMIFVTAYDEITVQSSNKSYYSYLSKPINPEKLREAIERVKKRENISKPETKNYEYSDSIYVPLNNNSF